MTDPVVVLTRLGGTARWGQMRRSVSDRARRRAVAEGRIVRTAYGRYALPLTDEMRVAASRLTGVASHTSAALHWGWAVKTVPTHPHVTVSRHRNITPERRESVCLHWRQQSPDDIVDGWVTSPVRTVIDCCLDLPFDEALSVFDSSWRAGLKPREVQRAALRLPKRQRDRVLAVARAADRRAANPFESVLRAIAMDVPGLSLEPQVVVQEGAFWARVDLADEGLRLVLEADSFEFHATPKAFDRDCRRYNALVSRDWRVLRFTWKQVMFEPDLVRETLVAMVALLRRPRHRSRSTGTKPRISAKSA